MKKIATLGLCLLALNASADCYLHSNIRMTRQNIVAGPTDFRRIATPDASGSHCVVSYRVYIGNSWRNAEGSASAKTESEACMRARDIGRGHVLAEVEPTQVSADMQMVCSDAPEIQIHPVRVGDVIWESETDLHTMPAERPYFAYKGTRCRYFTEQASRDNNLITYQGVICKIDSTPDSKWSVVDKF